MTDFLAAAETARRRGLPHLEAMFLRMAIPATRVEPKKPEVRGDRPRICMVVDHKGWCGERLCQELAKNLPEYDCKIVRLGDKEHLDLSFDMYIYRNASWIKAVQLPEWAYKKVVCIVESHRVLDMGNGPLLSKVNYVVPMTNELVRRSSQYGIRLWEEPIANGINTEEFKPADDEPEEFIVGAAGNFSLEYYDNWKGFSRYIVPACELAKVKLNWCSWQGKCQMRPDLKGSYIAPNAMGPWYKKLSAFVLMSQSEGCSGVTFEAMASGLPVISTKVGWHGENCRENLDGILWANRPNTQSKKNIKIAVEELAHKLCWLKAHPAAAKAIGMRGRAFAEKYTHRMIADKWRRLIVKQLG